MAGELSSDLLNQQLNEVRLDKDNILERLQIAETARFELQKMVTTLKEKHDDHVSSIDEKFEDSKVCVLVEELDFTLALSIILCLLISAERAKHH